MTEPNSSTTIPNYVAGSTLENTDIGRRINLLFDRADRAEKQWRDHELMRSRCATIHPSELRSAEEAASSSNTKCPTVPPATPEANGYLGASWRTGPPRSPGTMNLERPDAAITAGGASSAYIAFGLPYPPPRQTPSFNPNNSHPNAATIPLPTRSMGGTPGGYPAFGLRYQPRHETPTSSRNITHRSTGTTNLRTTPTGPIGSAPPGWIASRPRCISHYETPSYTTNITHPRTWGTVTNTPSGHLTPGATHACSTEMRLFDGYLKHRNAEAINLSTKPVTSAPSNLATRGASTAVETGASGVAGPRKVVTIVTHSSQRTLSASEIFKEVRECVVEYLGLDVER